MFQVKNEYGSYGKEKDYLKSVANLMRKHGLTAPFFTSDGPWRAFLRAGSLITDGYIGHWKFWFKSERKFSDDASFL